MRYNLYDLLVKCAHRGLSLQRRNGSFDSGHDGPWYNDDTPLRTTSHWALLLLKAFELTEDSQYLNATIKACNYLISEEARPFNYTFYCRKGTSGKDKCNGLIGQAWVLEALIEAGYKLGNEKYISTAKDVFYIIPYDFKKNSWNAVEIDGNRIGDYNTLNQQIWMTSMATVLGSIINDDNLLSISKEFFRQLPSKIAFSEPGLINHNYTQGQSLVKKKIKQIFSGIIRGSGNAVQRNLSIGYLPFLLYGLALVVDKCHNIEIQNILKGELLSSSLTYIELNYPYGYLDSPDSYRWSYNPVGIEMAYIYQVYGQKLYLPQKHIQKKATNWLGMQIKGYYNLSENLLNKNTADPTILAARFYEATRLDNYELDV